MGLTDGPDRARPMLRLDDGRRIDGAVSASGRVMGCYAHGLFARAEQRAAWLALWGAPASDLGHDADIDAALDGLATTLAATLDIPAIAAIAGLPA